MGLNPQADRHLVLVRGRDIEMQINHAAGSAHQLDGGARQLLRSLLERQSCGVAAGDAPEQVLQGAGAPQALQIAYEGQGAIGLASPAQGCPFGHVHPQRHRLTVLGKPLQGAPLLNGESQVLQGAGENGFVPQHGWQDGEMGHGPMPAFPDPSDLQRAVQWPQTPLRAAAGPRRLRIGVMASGNGSNFEALALACLNGTLAAEIVLLVVNNPGCGATQRAQRLGIPVSSLDHRAFASREQLDDALVAAFNAEQVDLVVMAGWMRIVTQRLIDAFPQRLVNIHPSLLPSFPGVDGVGQALRAGVRLSGCTAHLVSLEVDGGPILVQAAVPVDATDSHESLAARIHAQEHQILPLAVQLAAERLGLVTAEELD